MTSSYEAVLEPDSPPQKIFEAHDQVLGKLGYVVIDRPLLGKASGGIRFVPDVSVDEVSGLARSMTFKWGFLNVPMGGAKAGIFADPEHLDVDRETLMEAFGRSIADLVRKQEYIPGVDLGTTLEDLTSIMKAAGKPLPPKQIDGSYCTALTVFETIRQMVEVTNQDFENLQVAIEGYGKVGSWLSILLDRVGAKIIAISTEKGAIVQLDGLDVKILQSLKDKYGNDLVLQYPDSMHRDPHELFMQPCDLLVPGARPYAINLRNVDEINASWIVPISNIPTTKEVEDRLLARDIVVIPDFVANCGGILAANMLGMGFSEKDVERLVEDQFAEVVKTIFRESNMQGALIREIAEKVAWKNHLNMNMPEKLKQNWSTRLVKLLKEQGVGGIAQRLAWRIYNKWPNSKGVIRDLAIHQYGEWGLGETLKQIMAK